MGRFDILCSGPKYQGIPLRITSNVVLFVSEEIISLTEIPRSNSISGISDFSKG